MINRVRSEFAPQLSARATCLQECPLSEFHIHDPHPLHEGAGPCYISTTGLIAKSDLHVRNATQQAVHFIAIDHCIYDDSNPSKCDCALISGDKI